MSGPAAGLAFHQGRRLSVEEATREHVAMELTAAGCGEEYAEKVDRGPWTLSMSGKKLHLFDLQVEDIDPADIAHALSHLCRYNGHCREFYSVAQHSVLVASVLPQPLRLAGLLHDAAEAYIGDMVRPLKYSMPAYRELEDRIAATIAWRFGIMSTDRHPAIKEADNRMLMTERRDLLNAEGSLWTNEARPFDSLTIRPVPPVVAREMFLAAFSRYSA